MKQSVDSAEKLVARLLKNRLLSHQELKEKLQKKNYPPEVIATILEKSQPILNDELLAKNLIEHYRQKKIHPRLIRQKLIQRKIPQEIISRLLPEPESNQENITELIKQIFPRYQHLPKEVARRRLANYLSQRGYLPEDFGEILQKILPEENYE